MNHGDAPQNIYAEYNSTQNQAPSDTDPTEVTLNTTVQEHGISRSSGTITLTYKGVYIFNVRLEVDKTSGGTTRQFYFWLRKNDVDVSGTGTVLEVSGNDLETPIMMSEVVNAAAGDEIKLIMKVSASGEGVGIYSESVEDVPDVPSVEVVIHKLS